MTEMSGGCGARRFLLNEDIRLRKEENLDDDEIAADADAPSSTAIKVDSGEGNAVLIAGVVILEGG
jgi:hypothetical protein